MKDISSEYIKMCEKAVEIQEFFKITEDFIKVIPSFVYDNVLNKVCVLIYCPIGLHSQLRMDENCRQLILVLNPDEDEGRYMSEIDHPTIGESCIWLPRQYQLQEMVCGKITNPIFWSETFTNFHKKWLWLDFTSFEQLWLAFVMKEKYDKIWTGEKWTRYKPPKERRSHDG